MNKCKTCGKETKNKHYCSMKCRDISRKQKNKETRICKCCGKEFEAYKKSTRLYCSNSCSAKSRDYDVVIKKMKQTKLERYGDENYINTEKTKKTNLEKYGVEHVFQTKEFKEKSKNTTLEKYGVEYAIQKNEVKEKRKRTVDELYGGYTLESKELRKKVEQTNLEKYGVTHSMTPEVRKKVEETNLKKYGSITPLTNKDIKEKTKKTLIEKYGDIANISQTEENKQKIKRKRAKLMLEKINKFDHITPLFDENVYDGVYDNKPIYYKFLCNKCNTVFEDYLHGSNIPSCPHCTPKSLSNTSLAEKEIFEFLSSHYNKEIICNDRSIINPYELDIYIPEKKIAIEYNGIHWHTELSGGKDKIYHLNKTKLCEEKNIQLVQITDHEWLYKNDIVKSVLLNIIGSVTNKIMARKCNIIELSNKDKTDFVEQNHIQGDDKSSIRIGLQYNDEFVSVMTFQKSRFDKKYQYEIGRFCNKLNTSVIGGAQKIFSYFIKKYNPDSIITYSDRRLFSGKIYEHMGFKNNGVTPPSYKYVKSNKVFNRQVFQKHKLKNLLQEFDINLSEWENMQLNGYDRIWDCGNYKYTWKKT